MYRLGTEVQGIEPPLQMITTENDFLSGKKGHQKLLEGSAEGGPDGWYHFPAQDGVPHAMASRGQNPNTESVNTIETIIADFLSSGKLTQRPPA
jgi:hypothetical protein